VHEFEARECKSYEENAYDEIPNGMGPSRKSLPEKLVYNLHSRMGIPIEKSIASDISHPYEKPGRDFLSPCQGGIENVAGNDLKG